MASTPIETHSDPAAGHGAAGAPQGLVDRVRDQTGKFAERGVAKALELADARKDAAVDKLDAVVEVVRSFADGAEGEFGTAVGRTVRRGGDAIEGAARSLRDRSVSDIAQDSRDFIAKHPRVAVGAASILAFVAGRIAKAGLRRPGQRAPATMNRELAA